MNIFLALINWRAWIFFHLIFPCMNFFCASSAPPPPLGSLIWGQALLMIARIPSTIRNYRVHKKYPRNHLYPFFPEFLKKVIGSAKNELFWSEIGGSFQKACRTDTTSIFQESSSWAANGPYANYTTRRRLWAIFFSLTLSVHEYSFQPFYSRKPSQTWTKLVGLVVWNLLFCVNMHKGYLLLTLWNIY